MKNIFNKIAKAGSNLREKFARKSFQLVMSFVQALEKETERDFLKEIMKQKPNTKTLRGWFDTEAEIMGMQKFDFQKLLVEIVKPDVPMAVSIAKLCSEVDAHHELFLHLVKNKKGFAETVDTNGDNLMLVLARKNQYSGFDKKLVPLMTALKEKGVDPAAVSSDKKRNGFMWAAFNGSPDLVKWFAPHTPDLDLRDENNQAAISIAVESQSINNYAELTLNAVGEVYEARSLEHKAYAQKQIAAGMPLKERVEDTGQITASHRRQTKGLN